MQADHPTEAGDTWLHGFTFAVRDADGAVINLARGAARGPFAIWDMPLNGYTPDCRHRISVIHLPTGMSLAHGDSGAQAHRLVDLLWPHASAFRTLHTRPMVSHEKAALRFAVENHMEACNFSRKCPG